MAIVDFWTNKYRLDSLFGIQLFLCHFGVNYLRPHFATALGLLVWFWGELSAAEFCYGIRFIVLVLG